jgi:hypothetical protein
MNGFAVDKQNSLLRVKDKLPECANKSFVLRRFVYVKKMSKLCLKKSKTFSENLGEDFSAKITQIKLSVVFRQIVTPNGEENKKNK